MTEDHLPFELRWLELFLAVCESGTMSGAARGLGLTQSAVSQAIAELETRIGTTLFDRNVRPLGLTVSGIVLRQRASALLADARQIVPHLREVRKGKMPLIRVGIVDSFSSLLLPQLPEHLLRFADSVSFVSGLTSSHVDDIFGRRLDIVLGVDEFDDLEGVESWPLLDESYVILLPRGVAPVKSVADLRRLSETLGLVRYHPRRKIGVAVDRHLRRIRVDLPRTLEFDTPFGVTAMVAAGRGWAITTPLCVFESRALLDKVHCQPLPGPELKRRLSLIARSQELSLVPKEAAAFASALLRETYVPAIAPLIPWIDHQKTILGDVRRKAGRAGRVGGR